MFPCTRLKPGHPPCSHYLLHTERRPSCPQHCPQPVLTPRGSSRDEFTAGLSLPLPGARFRPRLTPDCLCWGVSDGDLCRGPPAAPRGPAPAPREPREAAPAQGATLESTQGSRGTPPASPSTGAESRAASERGEGRGPSVQRRCSPSPWLALLRPSLISIPQHPAPIRIFLIVLLCHYRKIHIMH